VAQHGDRERGVVALVAAGELRQRQRQVAVAVVIGDRLAHGGPPVVSAHVQRRACLSG
jgi:hypothetical protein